MLEIKFSRIIIIGIFFALIVSTSFAQRHKESYKGYCCTLDNYIIGVIYNAFSVDSGSARKWYEIGNDWAMLSLTD